MDSVGGLSPLVRFLGATTAAKGLRTPIEGGRIMLKTALSEIMIIAACAGLMLLAVL